MSDPYVFGAEGQAPEDQAARLIAAVRASPEGRAAAARMLEAEARALARGYHAHGDHLLGAEAEAAADRHHAEGRRLTAGAWLRGIRRLLGDGP